MTWQQAVIWYIVLGIAAYVVGMLGIHYFESITPAGVFRQWGEGLARWAEEVEQQKNPSRLRWLKNASAKWTAHLLVAVLIVAVWPVAMVWKGRNWFLQYKETETQRRELRNNVAKLGVPFVDSDEITLEEKIYVLYFGSEGKWLWDVPEFADLMIGAQDFVLMMLMGAKEGGIADKAFEVMRYSEDELEVLYREDNTGTAGRTRVAKWRQWSKSTEAKAVEDFFREMWAQQNKAASAHIPIG